MPSDADFILIFLAGLLVSTRGRRGPTPVLTTNAFAFSRADLNFNLIAPANVQSYVYLHIQRSRLNWRLVMSKNSTKIALAFLVILAVVPTASFARMAGEAGAGNLPISGIPLGPANPGGLNNAIADPSGIGNASKMAQLPQPRITVPKIPQFK
jgi:hypothetical protein